jgi:hypothetical protein
VEYLDSRESLATFLDRGEAMKAELLRFAHIKAGADPGDDPEANICQVHIGEIKRWITEASTIEAAGREAIDQAIVGSGMSFEEYTNATFLKGASQAAIARGYNIKAWAEEQGLSEQEAIEALENMPPRERLRITEPPTLD